MYDRIRYWAWKAYFHAVFRNEDRMLEERLQRLNKQNYQNRG